jgi:hypothetical protein
VNEELAQRHALTLGEILGPPGRLISYSKSGYRTRHPDHVAVFNGNLCLEGGKVWHGDLDLTVDEPMLVGLARIIGTTVYVLWERDGRFDHEDKPLLREAVYSVAPSGQPWFEQKWMSRAVDGSLRRRRTKRRS